MHIVLKIEIIIQPIKMQGFFQFGLKIKRRPKYLCCFCQNIGLICFQIGNKGLCALFVDNGCQIHHCINNGIIVLNHAFASARCK